MDHLTAAANQFNTENCGIERIEEFGNGNVNDTYLVTLDSQKKSRFILQRINTHVFRQPELVMHNIRMLTEHAQQELLHAPPAPGRRWELPRVLPTHAGRDHWIADDGSFWRAISFIEKARSFDTIQDMQHAAEAGYALGMFHRLISNLRVAKLADTLKGFHITSHYLQHYDEIAAGNRAAPSLELLYCSNFIRERRSSAQVLEEAKAQGRLNLRPIHGDPKVNNVMIDNDSGQAVSIIDLDTVKPGLIHYDIGDCLRSCCNPLGEETQQLEQVRFELDLCRAILQGYLSMAGEFLTEKDCLYLYDAVRLIAFELGLRFFTDYLEGDVYFKAKHREHNLSRALVQFKLVESIESKASEIHSIIQSLR